MHTARFGLAVLLALTCLGTAQAGRLPTYSTYALDDVEPWSEGNYTLPAYPDKPEWVGFYVHHTLNNLYFVDAKTLSVGEDGVVHFILRVLSPSGAENLSVEGIHCQDSNYRSYAFGDSYNKRWIEATRADWRKFAYDDKLRQRLHEDICIDKTPPKSAEAALQLLKKAPWR